MAHWTVETKITLVMNIREMTFQVTVARLPMRSVWMGS